MKIKTIFLFVGLAIIILSSLIIIRQRPKVMLMKQQEELANLLEVDIEDYPAETLFPYGYFNSLLEPGMSIDDVHRIVRNYTTVYHCQSLGEIMETEIYYFYSNNDYTAIRFKIIYQDGEFVRMESEDDDSRTIHISDCELGALE